MQEVCDTFPDLLPSPRKQKVRDYLVCPLATVSAPPAGQAQLWPPSQVEKHGWTQKEAEDIISGFLQRHPDAVATMLVPGVDGRSPRQVASPKA